jgi:hypothetical protein
LGIGDFDAGTDTTGIRESAPVFIYLLMQQHFTYSTSRIDVKPPLFHASVPASSTDNNPGRNGTTGNREGLELTPLSTPEDGS